MNFSIINRLNLSSKKNLYRFVQSANNYHNGSAYYGYRPKPESQWKGKLILFMSRTILKYFIAQKREEKNTNQQQVLMPIKK